MRLLSNEEKDLCLRISKGNKGYNLLQNIIDHKLHDILISVTTSNKKVEILFPVPTLDTSQLPTEKIQSRLEEVGLLILTTCNLISLLEKEGYILVYQKANIISDNFKFGKGIIENTPGDISYQFPDLKTNEILINYLFKVIVTTPEFDRFCKKGFIARDEQRFKKQIGIAYTALAVALFAAFVNLGFNLWSKFSGGITIKKEQINEISHSFKRIENKLDTLNVSILSSSKKIKSKIINQ